MTLKKLDGRIVRLTETGGKTLTGTASYRSAGTCDREEDCVEINGNLIPESGIQQIVPLPQFAVLRAAETWQQAGAYYVRIQAMARKHRIPLRQEFDEHDTPGTKYIVVTDEDFPIATARMYPLDDQAVMIGRVVVLPEYRHQGIGTMVVRACEEWAEELGFSKTVVESRDNKTAFYEELGYTVRGEPVQGETFRCIRMEKELRQTVEENP